MTILIDTSVLVAAAYTNDANHQAATKILLQTQNQVRIVPQTVLTETFFLVAARRNYRRAIETFVSIRKYFQIVSLEDEDMTRMEALMNQYRDVELDYADTSIIAIAERLKITRSVTFDRRDFRLVRPLHIPHFDLLP
ncbi:MAG: PIN domain-containing protein [Chloroflexota bacterium]|nr:PIN domain-containing protein [Chloroflexota bacterium]